MYLSVRRQNQLANGVTAAQEETRVSLWVQPSSKVILSLHLQIIELARPMTLKFCENFEGSFAILQIPTSIISYPKILCTSPFPVGAHLPAIICTKYQSTTRTPV